MSILSDAAQAVMKKAVELAPDSLIPGGRLDPLIRHKHGLVGHPIPRIDGRLKAKARRALRPSSSWTAWSMRPWPTAPSPGAALTDLDTREAEAAPGVVLIMTNLNAPKMTPPPAFGTAPKAKGGDSLPVMQDDTIHWNGEPIAVVLAETQEQADHAKSLIRATYAIEPSVTSFEAAEAKGTQIAAFQGEKQKLQVGDAEAALAASAHKVDVVYRTPRHTHNAIEPHAATLARHGDELIVHDATQAVSHTAWTLAQVFGLKEHQVHVTSPYVPSSFFIGMGVTSMRSTRLRIRLLARTASRSSASSAARSSSSPFWRRSTTALGSRFAGTIRGSRFALRSSRCRSPWRRLSSSHISWPAGPCARPSRT